VYAACVLIFMGATVFALWGTYMAEHQARSGYLYSLLARLQNSELDRISRFDPLTGLGNRRLLEELVHECRRGGEVSRLTMIMIDLDHFKKLNDALGHQAGDRCLVRVAGLVQGALRDHRDHAFRYGGEEFLVVLQDAPRDTAAAVAERIRAAIEAAGIPNPGLVEGAVLTASLGLSMGALRSRVDAERLVAEADAALYAAKRAGRNQVAWHRS
jgi:diguanylate cyclase (GGDEF)-like protein